MGLFGGDNALYDQENSPLPEEEDRVLDKFAKWFAKWGAAGSIIGLMAGESIKPANFILSQGLIFAEPTLGALMKMMILKEPKDYDTFYKALEKRESIEVFLQKLEAYDAENRRREKAFKKWQKVEKKHWRWYQRYLGVMVPRVDAPDWVKNPPEDPGELDRLAEEYRIKRSQPGSSPG